MQGVSQLSLLFRAALRLLCESAIVNKFYVKDLTGDGFKAKSVKIGTVEQISMSVGFPVPMLEAAAA